MIKLKNPEYQAFFWSFISVTALFIFCLSLFTVRFAAIDDAFMLMVASGLTPGNAPSEYLMYTHFLIGLVLKWLYIHWPDIAWFGIYLYFLLYVAFVGIGFSILRLKVPVILWVSWLIVFGVMSAIAIQFTIVPLFLAGSGVLLIGSLSFLPASPRLSKWIYSIAILCIVIAVLIRDFVIFPIIFFVVLFYVLSFLYNKLPRRNDLFTFIGILIFSYALIQIDKLYYSQSPEWKNFHTYNALRTNFNDYFRVRYTPENQDHFKHIGWSENDFDMIKSWFYVDKKIYSQENLQYLVDHARDGFRELITSYSGYKEVLDDWPRITWFSVICIFFIMFYMFPLKGKQEKIAFLLILGWLLANFILVSIANKMPPFRFWMPILGVAAVLPLLFFQFYTLKPRFSFKGRLQNALVLWLFVLGVHTSYIAILNLTTAEVKEQLANDIKQLAPTPDQKFVAWGASLPYEYIIEPFKVSDDFKNFNIIGIGTSNQTPVQKNTFSFFNIQDVYQALYTRNDIYLISRKKPKVLKQLTLYLKEHYGVDTQNVLYFKGKIFDVYQVKLDHGKS